MVYDGMDGSLFQPVTVMIPAEALRRAAELDNSSRSFVRVVNILYRTSALFQSNDTAKWVGID